MKVSLERSLQQKGKEVGCGNIELTPFPPWMLNYNIPGSSTQDKRSCMG